MRELHELLTSLGLESDSATATAVLQKYDTDQTGLLELPEFSKFIRALGAHPAGGGGADLNRALQLELPHLRDGSPSRLRSRDRDRGGSPERNPEGRRRGDARDSWDARDDAEHVRQLEGEVQQLQQQLQQQGGGGYGGGGGGGGGRGGDGVSQDMVRDVIRSVASELVGSMPRQMARTAPAGARHPAQAQARGDPALSALGRGGVNAGASLDASEERLYDDVMRARDATTSRQSRHLNAALQQDRAHAARGGVKVVDRRTGQSKGEVLKGRFPWQRELENFPSR